jgi:hypothetical protein
MAQIASYNLKYTCPKCRTRRKGDGGGIHLLDLLFVPSSMGFHHTAMSALLFLIFISNLQVIFVSDFKEVSVSVSHVAPHDAIGKVEHRTR